MQVTYMTPRGFSVVVSRVRLQKGRSLVGKVILTEAYIGGNTVSGQMYLVMCMFSQDKDRDEMLLGLRVWTEMLYFL